MRDVFVQEHRALALHVALFHVALAALTLGGMGLVVDGPIEARLIVSLFAGTATLAVCFAGLAMLAATIVPPRTAGNAALSLVLAGYLMSVLGALSPQLAWLALSSPFHWVAPARIVQGGGLDVAVVAALGGIGIAAATAAIVRYERRDILG